MGGRMQHQPGWRIDHSRKLPLAACLLLLHCYIPSTPLLHPTPILQLHHWLPCCLSHQPIHTETGKRISVYYSKCQSAFQKWILTHYLQENMGFTWLLLQVLSVVDWACLWGLFQVQLVHSTCCLHTTIVKWFFSCHLYAKYDFNVLHI